MVALNALLPLAHAGHGHDGGGADALAVIGVAAMVIPLTVLGFVGWGFYRSAKREREDSEARVGGVSGP